MDTIFIIFGEKPKSDFSNVTSISTKIIPSVGEEISLSKGLFKVKRKVIDYGSVEEYDLEQEGRGAERVWIYV